MGPNPIDNVFAGAHPHVASWPSALWHPGIGSPRSSQALCVSVWGTIAEHRRRTAIVNEIFAGAGLELGDVSTPRIRCEAGADGGLAYLLNETGGNATPTCVDATVGWPGGLVCIESKFTESSFGACSQTKPRIDRPPGAASGTTIALGPACNGTYGPGSDLKTGTRAPCRLGTWDGTRAPRLYWDLAWDLFRPEILTPAGLPCPFAGPSFQLMRNLALARAGASPRSVRPHRDGPPHTQQREWGLLVAHVDAHPNAASHREELDAFRDLLLAEVRPRVARITYEQILPVIKANGLSDLAKDVELRIAAAV